jgi:hydroxymethylpyrimidine/phosphomethylpyrimidine kinase
LSSAIAVLLARGRSIADARAEAQRFVGESIVRGRRSGSASGAMLAGDGMDGHSYYVA